MMQTLLTGMLNKQVGAELGMAEKTVKLLLNLLMNSMEAMHSSPAYKRGIVTCTKLEAESFVSVSMRDYGCGLPEDNLDKVFAHFYSTKPNGMGMGLTIVRSIVETHRGALSAENTEDGARFCFRLPAAPAPEAREVV